MNIRKYITAVLDATDADEVQIEVHIDENMNVDPLSPSLIRFNAYRQTSQGKITPPPVGPEEIVNELKGEKVGKHYQTGGRKK